MLAGADLGILKGPAGTYSGQFVLGENETKRGGGEGGGRGAGVWTVWTCPLA